MRMLVGWVLNCRASCSRQVAAAERISKLSLPGNRVGLKITGPPSRPRLLPVALGHIGVLGNRCMLTSVCFIAIIQGQVCLACNMSTSLHWFKKAAFLDSLSLLKWWGCEIGMFRVLSSLQV